MTISSHSAYQYQAGGSLPTDAPTYVIREADTELFNGLMEGQYCYVLNARQMGKSSLRIQTMARLNAQGIACAEIELSGIGSQQITAQQWYGGMIQELVSGFALQIDRRSWLRQHNDLSPVQRLHQFIETVLLVQVPQNIVIFIDEIDSVLSLSFPVEEFFALIRNSYERRATKPAYRRLTFALLGVATPADLIQDERATPFNIGRAVELKGFQLRESAPLVQGFAGKVPHPQALLKAILAWTGGQPFLTQKLCWLLAHEETLKLDHRGESAWVARVVQARVLKNWETQDEPEHLRTVRDRILRNARNSRRLLQLYQRILTQGRIVARDIPEHLELRLSGLVVRQGNTLTVKNQVYEKVFDRHWVRQELAFLRPALKSLPISWGIGLSTTVAAMVVGMRLFGWLQAFELQAFDHLMRLQPWELPDERLLIVGADAQDLVRFGFPLPDGVLAQLLSRLESLQPSVIGLDIIRDVPVTYGYQKLLSHFTSNPNIVGGCAYGNAELNTSIKPPPEMPMEQVGFFDLYSEHAQFQNRDYTIRRYLLSRSPNAGDSLTPCSTLYSFGFQLAFRYLAAKQIRVTTIGDDWQFGSIVAQRLQPRSGGYQNLDAAGNQLLIRYRHTLNPQEIAPTITFRDVIDGSDRFRQIAARNQVVLVGVIDHTVPDPHLTPYGQIRGLYIHANVVSQILSAVESPERGLWWWWPSWGDAFWILAWSVIGGGIILVVKLALLRGLGFVVATGVLYGSCWLAVLYGGWIPLIPTAISLLSSGLIAGFWDDWLKRRQQP